MKDLAYGVIPDTQDEIIEKRRERLLAALREYQQEYIDVNVNEDVERLKARLIAEREIQI